MSFTRFHDDEARIQQQLRMQTSTGRYFLETPGPGSSLSFFEDPHMRLQRWGANLRTETINLDSDLRGLTRNLCRDDAEKNNYQSAAVSSTVPTYGIAAPTVEESRASVPAWQFRDLEHPRWEEPWINPQSLAHLEKPFFDNLPTRMLEKDYFRHTDPRTRK
jgi:hypothetical protein